MAAISTCQATWAGMARIEPRLRHLVALAQRGGDWHAYENVKLEISGLVGWHAADPRLRTSLHHDIAIRHLLRVWERSGDGR